MIEPIVIFQNSSQVSTWICFCAIVYQFFILLETLSFIVDYKENASSESICSKMGIYEWFLKKTKKYSGYCL